MAIDKNKARGDEREHAHRHETDFKTMAKRNRLFGLWIGEQIGLHGDAASAYARDVIMADLEEPGEEDLFRKVRGGPGTLRQDDFGRRSARQAGSVLARGRARKPDGLTRRA